MRARLIGGLLFAHLWSSASWAQPLGAAFTYQGRLSSGGVPANGPHDMQFRLHPSASGGGTIFGPICLDGVSVVGGLFSVVVDFGPVFDGSALWLSVSVRPDSTPGNCGSGSYTLLSPRLALTATPYAARALSAPNGHALNAVDGNPVSALFVDSVGEVGVSTTTPSMSFEVAGPTNLYNRPSLGVSFNSDDYLYMHAADDPSFIWPISDALRFGNETSRGAGYVERMRISSDGKLGIGTDSPENALQVSRTLGGSDVIALQHDLQFQINNGIGEKSMGIGVLDGGVGMIQVKEINVGYNSLLLNPNGGFIQLLGDNSTGNAGVRQAYTNNDFAVRNGLGNPFVFSCYSTTGSSLFQVQADGDVLGCGITCLSDARKKTNVEPLHDALATVRRLRGVTFDWIDPERARNGRQIGFIAQEVEAIAPNLVKVGEDGSKFLNYQGVTPLLAEAIEEQQAQIDAQRTRIEGLRSDGELQQRIGAEVLAQLAIVRDETAGQLSALRAENAELRRRLEHLEKRMASQLAARPEQAP